jgi:hypothetical protein
MKSDGTLDFNPDFHMTTKQLVLTTQRSNIANTYASEIAREFQNSPRRRWQMARQSRELAANSKDHLLPIDRYGLVS